MDVNRHLADAILTSLTDSPVVFIQGARQTGKSTLARSLKPGGAPARYLTLDNSAVLSAAESDPSGFIDGLSDSGARTVIDEVQRAPGLALAIKAAVDSNRRPGQFLLTGSAHFMVLPKLADSLAGRMEIHTLRPFSQGELHGQRDAFIDAIFGQRFLPGIGDSLSWKQLAPRIVQGGYPEMIRRLDSTRRRSWFESYITAILQRDVRDISNVRDLDEMPRVLTMAASRAAGLLDYADISRSLAMPQTTLKRYMGLLEATFLIHLLPAWSVNIGKRLVKAPKLLLNDTGLLLHLLGAADRLATDTMLGGPVLENFVALELFKQQGWSRLRPEIHHFRTHSGDEVDLVLEDGEGRVVGVEVKASGTVTAGDFKGLRVLAEAAGARFVRGIVLYTGDTPVPFAKNLMALPVTTLWAAQPL
jgi:predicted AAA+ superfamily ATPase